MNFIIDKSKYFIVTPENSSYYITDDGSLLFNGLSGDYSVLLGGDWRLDLVVDSDTGLCTHVQSYLPALSPTVICLNLPQFISGDLFFISEEKMIPGEGCHYNSFKNSVFWDDKKRILCFGDPMMHGDSVEFAKKTIATLNNNELVNIFMVLDELSVKEFPFQRLITET